MKLWMQPDATGMCERQTAAKAGNEGGGGSRDGGCAVAVMDLGSGLDGGVEQREETHIHGSSSSRLVRVDAVPDSISSRGWSFCHARYFWNLFWTRAKFCGVAPIP